VELIQQTKERLGRASTVSMMNDLQHVTSTCIRLQDMLSKLLDYVDSVTVSRFIWPILSYLLRQFCDVKAHRYIHQGGIVFMCDFGWLFCWFACDQDFSKSIKYKSNLMKFGTD